MQLEIPFRTREKLEEIDTLVEKEMADRKEQDFLPKYKPENKQEYISWLYKYCEKEAKTPKKFESMKIRQLAAIYNNICKKKAKKREQAEIFIKTHHLTNQEDVPEQIYSLGAKELIQTAENIRKEYL